MAESPPGLPDLARLAIKGIFDFTADRMAGAVKGRFIPAETTLTVDGLPELPSLDDLQHLDEMPALDETHGLGEALGPEVPEAVVLPPDIFANVVGLDDELAVLRLCYTAPSPLNAVLNGPPGGGKSVILDALATSAPSTVSIVGRNTTPRGLLDILDSDERPHVVIIDEIEKSSKEFQDTLLAVMTQKLAVHRHGVALNEQIDTRFIAASNTLDGVTPALRSRMIELNLRPYDRATAHRVIQSFLVSRKGCTPEQASKVADLVTPHSTDVRDAEQIAVVYQSDPELATRRAAALGTPAAA